MTTHPIATLPVEDEHHAVQFYEDDVFLAARVADHVKAGLAAGEPCIIIATATHRDMFAARLGMLGVDVDAAVSDGHLLQLDADETLELFIEDGQPNWRKFLGSVGEIVRDLRAKHGERPVRAYGEMVDILWRRAAREEAVALEEMWNQLGDRERIKLLCAYGMSGFEGNDDGVARICGVHTHRLQDDAPTDRTRELEAEVQRRRELERTLRAREQELSEFLDTAMEGIHFVAADGTILYANRAELEMLGYTREEYVGRNIADVHVDLCALERMLARLVRNESFVNEEVQLRCKDGSVRDVLVSSNALFRNGKFAHTRCFTRDVTRQKRAIDAVYFLAHASKLLASSRAYEGTLAAVMQAAVPSIADHAEVCLFDSAGQTRLRIAAPGAHHASILRIPLTAESKVVGELSLSWSSRTDTEDDRRVAYDLARRIGATIENALHCEQVEAANRAKDEFLAVVSHELRTPLNAILGWSRMLKDDRMPAEKRTRALDTIERNARAQNKLIEDLLDVSRIVSGKLCIDMESFDLRSVVERAVEAAAPAVSAKGLELRVVMPETLPPLLGDAQRLQQCVANLLNNAVKFSARGCAIHLTVRNAESNVEIEVRDDGQGIAPELLPHVFERFRQGDSRTTRAAAGLGLGLAIVKNLVELHGGSVLARSDGVGCGATFTIRLDASRERRAVPAVKPNAARSRAPVSLAGLRVLVVDDEEDARQLVSEVLAPCDVSVQVAGSAREALDALERDRFDAVVSDIGMPGEDGYAMIAAIRARPTLGTVPVIALTAFARSEERAKILAAGFDTHLSKPVEPDELVAVVSSVVRARFAGRA